MFDDRLFRQYMSVVPERISKAVLAVVFVLSGMQSVFVVPVEINYQGYLTDPWGASVDTTVSITLSFDHLVF